MESKTCIETTSKEWILKTLMESLDTNSLLYHLFFKEKKAIHDMAVGSLVVFKRG